NGPVLSPGSEHLPRRGKGKGIDGALESTSCCLWQTTANNGKSMRVNYFQLVLEPTNLTSRSHLPKPDCLILATCRQKLPVRRKCDGSDGALEVKTLAFLPCCHVPEPSGRFVVACSNKCLAVGRELHWGAEPVGGLEFSELLP